MTKKKPNLTKEERNSKTRPKKTGGKTEMPKRTDKGIKISAKDNRRKPRNPKQMNNNGLRQSHPINKSKPNSANQKKIKETKKTVG